MKINSEDYNIVSDGLNIYIEKIGITKDGKEKTKNVTGYHSTFRSLFKSFLEHELLNNNCQSVEEVIAKLVEIEHDLNTICDNLADNIDSFVSKDSK